MEINMDNSTAIPDNNVTLTVSGYRLVHGYLSGFVCLCSVVGNIINAIVWSRRHMLTSTNYILTALAIADALSAFMYFLYAMYFFVSTGPSESIYHSEAGMYLVLIAFHEFLAFHTLANWLTISLAAFRYMKVCHDKIARTFCNVRRAKLAILITLIVTFFATIPFYLYYEVYDQSDTNLGHPGYWLRRTTFVENHKEYQLTLLWLYGVIFKVFPSGAMIVMGVLIIRELRNAKRRHDDIHTTPNHSSRMSAGYSRTTIMLLIIVSIYVATELPIGITSFVAGLDAKDSHFFYFLLYSYVGDIIDLIALINGALNLFVYYALSKQFRDTLKTLLFSRCFKKYSPEAVTRATNSDTTDHELSTLSRSKNASIIYTVKHAFKHH